MFVQGFMKQLSTLLYSSYVPLQIFNYSTTLTRAQDVGGPFQSQNADNHKVRCKGPLRLRQCQGGYWPLSSPHSLPMSVEMRGAYSPPATVCKVCAPCKGGQWPCCVAFPAALACWRCGGVGVPPC